MSMNPGASTSPARSTTWVSGDGESAPGGATAAIRSPVTATSAARRGAPLPSISSAFRSSRSMNPLLTFGGSGGFGKSVSEPAVQVLRGGLIAAEHHGVEQSDPDAGLGAGGDPEVLPVHHGFADPRGHVHDLGAVFVAQPW